MQEVDKISERRQHKQQMDHEVKMMYDDMNQRCKMKNQFKEMNCTVYSEALPMHKNFQHQQ